jgi:hypothetical protein
MRVAFQKLQRSFRGRPRQQLFPFLARLRQVERRFRWALLILTTLGLIGLWIAIPSGSSALVGLAQSARWKALRGIGLEPPRDEVDAYWRDRRDRREVRTRALYRESFAALTPDQKTFLQVAGMGPNEAVIRWGNYDMTFVLSSKVFARDDDGRYYRLLPNVRSVWCRQISVFGLDTCQFLVPETPEVLRAAEKAGATVVPGTAQTTNSWGCRGPEPDPSAPVRGLVLGDSFMQGYFVADNETPPECLRRCLEARIRAKVSILNTGHLAYSPEHYYRTLCSFADRFRPGFVVLAFFVNDFGDEAAVLRGEGDWNEGIYWFEKILQYCRSRGILCLLVPVPDQSQLIGTRNPGHYPDQVANSTRVSSSLFCDPTDGFVNENLRLTAQHRRAGRGMSAQSLLYNGHLGDCHLSPLGSALWGRIVAQRLGLLLDSRNETRSQSTEQKERSPLHSD